MKKTLLLLTLFSNTLFAQNTFPKIEGKVIKNLDFDDKLGKNNLILSKKEDINSESVDIYAYLYRNGKEIWKVRDFVHNCDLGSFGADFILDAVQISDLDNNGIKEVWLPYTLECRGAPELPLNMKIIIYENQNKYALRGKTKMCFSKPNQKKYCYEDSHYELDNKLKEKYNFMKYALDLWNKYHIIEIGDDY